MNKLFGSVFFVILILAASARVDADKTPSVVVNFKPGQVHLDTGNKASLRRFFQTHTLGPKGRVFVVGHTDTMGDKNRNYKLSRQRAETVRREIVRAFKVDGAVVMALGKGAGSPVADNKSAKGRALNRRAEIYLVNGQAREPERMFGPGDPYLPDIETLTREAERLIKDRRLDNALQKLAKARALGADHYSQWHTVYGMAGFYAAAPYEEIRAHLVTALNLDPYDLKAREFLSRTEARQKVARGDVTKDMGRSVQTAINITAVAQQYEYLRLFEVEPLAHQELESRPVDMWQCLDEKGAPVVYYFNRSQVYHWAFAHSPAGRAVNSSVPAARSANPAPAGGTHPGTGTPASGHGADHSNTGKETTIWDSKIFK